MLEAWDKEHHLMDDGNTTINSEDVVLMSLGYRQELRRSFGFLGMIGFCFSIVTSWSALSGVLVVGIQSGGPPVMIWSWLGTCAASLAVAYSLAEMCSAYPVAGGQYSWVAILSPPKWARGLSYVCGWFMLIGIIAMGTVSNFISANFILGIAHLSNPNYIIERWHTVLVAWLVALLCALFNIFGRKLLERLSKVAMILNISFLIIVVVTILAMTEQKQSPSFVFQEFQNSTGFNKSYAAILGLLQSAFGMCCYDAPAHMTEEMVNARREAPKAIVMAVYINTLTGLVFLIAVCFCIVDIDAVATTSTGVPLIQIFYDSTGTVGGACGLAFLIFIIGLLASNALMVEGSRAVYAFARDHGLPFSRVICQVDRRLEVPVYATVVVFVVQIALNAIYFGSLTGFNTVISISTEGFYLSYAMPLFVRILSRLRGEKKVLEGPYSLGRWGLPLNIFGFLFLVFTSITFNLPSLYPVDSGNMNYTSAAVGAIMLIAAATWATTGRKSFTGPMVGPVFEGRSETMAQLVRPENGPKTATSTGIKESPSSNDV